MKTINLFFSRLSTAERTIFMQNKIMTYIGSYSGVSKKGNDFTVSHFMCDPDERQKGVHGKTVIDFFLGADDVKTILSLAPMQNVSIDYVYAGGQNVLVKATPLK